MDKRGVRATTSKFFVEALKEESGTKADIATIASNLESAVFDKYKSESTKEYRDKINFLKMRLKGIEIFIN